MAGKAHRKGLTLLEVADMFRDEQAAKSWLADRRWPDVPYCRTLRFLECPVRH